jgi:RND superfamily putative drug exporter
MGETGGVVTAAGLVFAFTMMSMVASDLRSIGQAGSAIGSAYCSTPWSCAR